MIGRIQTEGQIPAHYFIKEAEKALVRAREAVERKDYYSLSQTETQCKDAATQIRRALKNVKAVVAHKKAKQ